MVAVHTVGAGGGSIAWRDPGGALRVGPQSAGADPGPACYGRGGTEPTVTDANLLLGYLSADAPLAGGVALDREASERAIERLAGGLGLEPLDCAAGIIRVANAEMVRALRVVTVQRGIDPRRYALLAFGGAGPSTRARSPRSSGSRRSSARAHPGVLAALGLVVSPRRRDVQRSVFLSGDELTDGRSPSWYPSSAGRRGASWARPRPTCTPSTSCAIAARRSSSLSRPGSRRSPQSCARGSRAAHEERYGYRDAEQELELVTLRVSATVPGAEVSLERAPEAPDELERGRRPAIVDGAGLELEVLRGAPPPGTEIAGPARRRAAGVDAAGAAGWAGRTVAQTHGHDRESAGADRAPGRSMARCSCRC